MTDFDPTTVPPFPLLNLDLRDDNSVLVDGSRIDTEPGQEPTDAGVAAVAAIARDQGLTAVRVRATATGSTYRMVVTADGDIYPLDDPAEVPRKAGLSRRQLIIASSGALAIVVAATTTGILVTSASRTPPTPISTTAAVPPGYLANLPVVAPPGTNQQAAWALPIDDRTTPTVLANGNIALVDASGNLRIVNGTTGATLWRGNGAPTGQSSRLQITNVNGRPVIAASSGRDLTVWPLDTYTGSPVASTTVPLGADADVTYDGTAPLVSLPDQTVAFLAKTGLTRLDVPVTAVPVLATNTHVIAANRAAWWMLAPSKDPVRHTLPIPRGADGAPEVMRALDDEHLLAVWATRSDKSDVAAIIDLRTNKVATQVSVPAGTVTDRDETIRSSTGNVATVGALYVAYGDHPGLLPLRDIEPTAVVGATVYGTIDRGPVAAVVSGGKMTITPFTTVDTDDVALPIGATPAHAYVVASKVEETLLYALPRKETTK